MAKRSRDWNEGLAHDLRNREFMREFVLALLDEGFTLQQALGKTIRAYGVKEYAAKAKMPSSNVVRVVDGRHSPTQATLEQLLRPIGLRLGVAPTVRRKTRAA